MIHDQGFSTPIEKFEIIGIGHRYIRMLFTLFYDPKLKVKELAVLGYFCIATLISLQLDDSVGTRLLGPEAVILRTDGDGLTGSCFQYCPHFIEISEIPQ